MNVRYLVIAACLLLATPALGGDNVTLTAEQATEVLSALMDLDKGSCVGPAPSSLAPDLRVCTAFKLGAARGPMAIDVVRLREVVKAVQDASQKVRVEIVGGDKPVIPPAADAPQAERDAFQKQDQEFATRVQELMRQPHPIALELIKYEDLKIGDGADQNAIPLRVLAALSPILVGFGK